MTRPISDVEAAVVKRVLDETRGGDLCVATVEEIRKLLVVSRCRCGCDSVDFMYEAIDSEVSHILAEADGRAADGDDVGIIVWGHGGAITSLEIYNFSDKLPRLPVLNSIQPSLRKASSQKEQR